MSRHQNGGEPRRRWPPPGPLGQPALIHRRQAGDAHPIEQPGDLRLVETQGPGTQLGKVSRRAQPGHAHGRVRAGGDNQLNSRRAIAEKHGDLGADLRCLSPVEIIKDDDQIPGPLSQLLEEHGQCGIGDPVRVRPQGSKRTAADRPLMLGDHRDDLRPQAHRFNVARVESHPGERRRRINAGPFGEQRGLAEPRRGTHQSQCPAATRAQYIEQLRPGSPSPAATGSGQAWPGSVQHRAHPAPGARPCFPGHTTSPPT